MAKALDAPYEAGSRGVSWLKIKHAHTLDLVVLAAEWGHGRRTRLAVEPASRRASMAMDGGFVMLGKTFKGLTDAMLAVADAGAARARDQPRCHDGVRAAGARGGGRLQRYPGEHAIPGRIGAALRARQALPRTISSQRRRIASRRCAHSTRRRAARLSGGCSAGLLRRRPPVRGTSDRSCVCWNNEVDS